ncbi:hypothetical protein TWF481_000682 [Arthrobotrys musiformis]|uniref:Calcineurin-like phosphoesterase domain-containing protein n=1 Tax=Arthrobotrys musiformis TaxID=47236 RepID=A0AAV9WNB1_9PEZI
MPATRKPRGASNRVDVLARDLRKLSTTDGTNEKTGDATTRACGTRVIATRSAVRTGRQVLVEESDTLNAPVRRRRKKIDTAAKSDIKTAGVKAVKAVDKPKPKPVDTNSAKEKYGPILPIPEVKVQKAKVPDSSIQVREDASVEPQKLKPPKPEPPKPKPPTTIKTSFLLVSDTHDVQPQSSDSKWAPFRYPFPKTDVFIHAGDMTQNSNLSTLKTAISWIELIPAEIKILIAGNHDTCLDVAENTSDSTYTLKPPAYTSSTDDKENRPKVGSNPCRGYLKSKEMKAKGIFYLENEVKTFKLKNGARLTVFASPYTPRGPPPHHGGAFRYNSDNDFWEKLNPKVLNDPKAGGKVDVTVIHGPARGILDSTLRGRNVGCQHLRKFLEKVKPLMSVCGHIHEAAGVKVLEWDKKEAKGVEVQRAEEDEAVFTDARAVAKDVVRGTSTVFVNASLVGPGSSSYAGAARYPYVVELDLPLATV